MGGTLQRLFSTFANSWPGFGLLIQRLVTGVALIYSATVQLLAPTNASMFPQIAGAVLGLFIMAGLWTPMAGAFIVADELWIVFAGRSDIWFALILAALGGTLAMIGPGAWSIDAHLFGRKHIGS